MAFSRHYFPPFHMLPCFEDAATGDAGYFTALDNNQVVPNRTWCFMAEIVNDQLSSVPDLGHRVEVRDGVGNIQSVLFYPVSGHFDFGSLRTGNTLFVRYAHRYFFSDLSSEAVKVEDLNFVKVINVNLDMLLHVAHAHFECRERCMHCGASLAAVGGSAPQCPACAPATTYCSPHCRDAAAPQHASFCGVCHDLSDVLNVNFDTFLDYVPFRRTLLG